MNQNEPKRTNGKELAALKREKFRLKQMKKEECEETEKLERSYDRFFKEHSDFASSISVDQAKQLLARLREELNDETQQIPFKSRKRPHIECSDMASQSATSPLKSSLLDVIKPYFNLTNTDTVNRHQNYFIAEGTETVRMLIEKCASVADTDCENGTKSLILLSILTKPATFFEDPVNLQKTLEQSYPSFRKIPFRLVVGVEKALSEIIGFHLSRGALACGIIPHYDVIWLWSLLQSRMHNREPIRILALDQICDSANLGSLFRSSAAFGITAVILSDDSCSVFSRRCVRVSMGHCVNLPSIRVKNLSKCIQKLHSEFQINSYAAVIDNGADMVLESTQRGEISKAWCLVLGNEGNGISKEVIESCGNRLRISMSDGVDSLSVGVAAGILMHGIRERER